MSLSLPSRVGTIRRMGNLLELFDARMLNLIEAGFWIVLGFAAMLWPRAGREQRRIGRFIGLWLIIFGLSDLVEMSTGAWYRPWWLLVWKALCLLMLALGIYWDRASRRGAIDASKNASGRP